MLLVRTANLSTTHADRWTIRQVEEWIESIGLGMYRERFREYEVDGELLLDAVTDSILVCALHVRIRLHRWKILQEIVKLRRWSGDAAAARESAAAQVAGNVDGRRSLHHRWV